MRRPRKRQVLKWWKKHPRTLYLETTPERLKDAFESVSKIGEYIEFLYQCGVRTMFTYHDCDEYVYDKKYSVLRFKKKR